MFGRIETKCELSSLRTRASKIADFETDSYIILEYCDSKDMFSWINKFGPLSEHDAIYVFRQMMCAMEYCHSFNICHRDLKPENILLSEEGDIKIIDFGMAALHQNDQMLKTSCGSPHYAAPELLKNNSYRGDKADVWSMGVILFAMLAQRLPFDDPNLQNMLSLSKRAIYNMPEEFSVNAKDLIRRILVTDPEKRISLQDMWDHPLIAKYDSQPGFENTRRKPIDWKARSKDAPINSRDIDPQILRQLRAMWHSSGVDDIKAKLTSKGPNEHKTFYHLIAAHRDRLLENYDPDLTHSPSDYHHLRPQAWATRVSTRQFNTHGRTPSRFTVVSTVADMDAGGTVRSYDPYHASRNLAAPVQASRARIVIHNGKLEPGTARSLASGSVPSRMGTGASSRASRRLNSSLRSRTVSYAQSQRSSMSSIRSGIQGTSNLMIKPRHKRGVDFSSLRRNAVSDSRRRSSHQILVASSSIAGDQMTYNRDSTSPQSPRKGTKQENVKPAILVNDVRDGAPLLDEEMVHFSSSIAKDCDEAFGNSLLGSPPDSEGRQIRSSLTPFSIEFGSSSIQQTPEPACRPANAWDSRPLPPTPPMELTPSSWRTIEVKTETPSGNDAGAVSRYDSNHALGIAPLNTPSLIQRRLTSAPVYAQYARDARPLPSISESSPGVVNGQPRIVSAPGGRPTPLPTPNDHMNLDFLARAENTIRIVESPTARKSTGFPVMPEPLNVRKKSSLSKVNALEAHQVLQEHISKRKYSFHSQLQDVPEESTKRGRSSSNGSSLGAKKKISIWFRRNSKTSSKGDIADITPDTSILSDEQVREPSAAATHDGPPQRFCSTSTNAAPPVAPLQPAKKKSLMFWKSAKTEQRMSIAGTIILGNLARLSSVFILLTFDLRSSRL